MFLFHLFYQCLLSIFDLLTIIWFVLQSSIIRSYSRVKDLLHQVSHQISLLLCPAQALWCIHRLDLAQALAQALQFNPQSSVQINLNVLEQNWIPVKSLHPFPRAFHQVVAFQAVPQQTQRWDCFKSFEWNKQVQWIISNLFYLFLTPYKSI